MQVLIERKQKLLLDNLIKHCPEEVSGLGEVEIIDKDTLFVRKIHIFKQEVSSASTDLNPDALGDFVFNLLKDGKDKEAGEVKLWWHSHAKMEVFWSGTDTSTIKSLGTNTKWFLSIVGNHAKKYLCRLDVFQPFHITVDNIPLVVWDEESDGIGEAAKELINTFVEKKTYTFPTYTSYTIPIQQNGWLKEPYKSSEASKGFWEEESKKKRNPYEDWEDLGYTPANEKEKEEEEEVLREAKWRKYYDDTLAKQNSVSIEEIESARKKYLENIKNDSRDILGGE